jgi:hypothetical protein
MAFSPSSFFAGVGTVFAAITIGFAGGAMLAPSPKSEPNRVERVAANAPVVTPVAPPKSETPASPPAPATSVNTTEPAPAADRVIATTQPQNRAERSASTAGAGRQG